MFEIKGKYTTAKVMIDEIDMETMSQITSMVNHEAFTNPVAIMPDTHAGKGSVVGFTMELGDKIIPNLVGVDVGCAILSFKLPKDIYDHISMVEFDALIRSTIPFGTDVRETVSKNINWNMFYHRINSNTRKLVMEFGNRYRMYSGWEDIDDDKFRRVSERVGISHLRTLTSLGTLGGGNHYNEVGVSENTGDYWFTIHSGSRNFGKCVAEYWQKVAVTRMTSPVITKDQYVTQVKKDYDKKDWAKKINEYNTLYHTSGVQKGMEYLTGADMLGYLKDMLIAQTYAQFNRYTMMNEIVNALKSMGINASSDEYFETTHNFIDLDDWIIRKGSIRSYEDEVMLIPLNMKEGMLLCKGKSNKEWNCSAPHGAGRVLSRTQAKSKLNIEDATAQMEGIFTTCIPLDEAPDAYKSAELIESCIGPTVEIIDRIKPIMNLKCNG